MNITELIQILHDRSVPIDCKPFPDMKETRLQVWEQFVAERLPRDMSDALSEVKEPADFDSEQLTLLSELSVEDYALLLGDHEDKTFRSVGVPSPLALRRLWLGLDGAGDLARRVDYEFKGKVYGWNLWKAIYVANWIEEKPKKVKELVASIAPATLLEIFLRRDELDPDDKSAFLEPILEEGRGLPKKYVNAPNPEVVSWATRRAEELLKLSREERSRLDTSIVLAALASGATPKGTLPEKYHALFSLSSGSSVDTSFKAIVNRLPVAVLVCEVERQLAPFLDAAVAASPLRPLDGFASVGQIDFCFLPEVVVLVARAAQAFCASHPKLAPYLLHRAETTQWLLRASQHKTSAKALEPFAEFIAELGAMAVEEPKENKAKLHLADRRTRENLKAVELAQWQAIGKFTFASDDLGVVIQKTEMHRLAWTFAKICDTAGQRVADVWVGWYKGWRIWGHMFLPDTTERIQGVETRNGYYVGTTWEGTRIVELVKSNRREAFPELLDQWDKYYMTLGVA